MMPGLPELLIILVIVFFLFGAKRLPDLAKGLGKSITNFKAGLNEEQPDETERQHNKKQSHHQKRKPGNKPDVENF